MTMNVYQRMQKIMEAVAYVKKDKTVEGAGGGYRAVTHDMVTAMVHPHFLAHGIIIVPRLTHGETVATGRTTKAGTPIIRFEGTYEVAFVNVDDPQDRIVMTTAAHAEDQGDKAPGKALSYAVKGCILKGLMIETGEDDESRLGPVEKPLTDEQEQLLQTLRDKAMTGTKALEAAWKDLGKTHRIGLADHLASLKMAAAEADAAQTRKAA